MKLGEASGQLDAEFNPFADDFLGEILRAVTLAWAKLRPPKSSEWEDAITYRLAGRLQNDPSLPTLPYDIVPQYSLLDLDGRILGRLDLRFKHRHSQKDYFAFEAKRLHATLAGGSPSTGYPAYIGDEGMGAFVSGEYSQRLPAAGMLGYVMDGDTAKAWTGLATRIEAKRDELCLIAASQFIESSLKQHIESGLPDTCLGVTTHNLVSHTLRLFHLLLPARRRS